MKTSYKSSARPRFVKPHSLFAALTVAIAAVIGVAGECLAIDKGICGTWSTTINRPNGNIYIEWKIDPSGNYVVSSRGASGSMSETGKISTEGNRYYKTTKIGPDNGTFNVMGPRSFSTTGRWGFTEWTRVDGGGGGSSYGGGGGGSYNNPRAYQSTQQYSTPGTGSGGYDPDMNPRSKKWEQMGFGAAGTTKDQSGWTQNKGRGPANLQGADLKTLLFSSWPLPTKGDEVEQYGLPALGKAAAGGMRKRDFRLIQ